MNIKSISSRTRVVLLVAAGLLVASTTTAGAAAAHHGPERQERVPHGSRHPQRHPQGRRRPRRLADQGRLLRHVGPQGPRAPQGPVGPQGPAGREGRRTATRVPAGQPGAPVPGRTAGSGRRGRAARTSSIGEPVAANSAIAWGALCPGGTKVTGGGVSSTAPANVVVRESAPASTPQSLGIGWWAEIKNNGTALTAYVWAVCAPWAERRTSTPPGRGARRVAQPQRGSAVEPAEVRRRFGVVRLTACVSSTWSEPVGSNGATAPDPSLQSATDALVRPFVASRCDGDALPIHRPVSRACRWA